MGALRRIGWLSIGLVGCGTPAPETDGEDPLPPSIATLENPVDPIPLERDLDPDEVRLGERLFDDPILSGDGSVACRACHLFDKGGADGLARPRRPHRPEGAINVPTIFNLEFSYRFNWSARFGDLESQLDGPMKNPNVMGTDWPDVVSRLRRSKTYPALFAAIWQDGVTEANLREAIATYERSLFTPNAPFDRFLRGERNAIDARAEAGWESFKSLGCVSCHQGMNVGGNLVQKFGVMGDYFADRGDVGPADLGRFGVTHIESDRHVFRVPSLRNVARTAPYFHDGTAATLEEAVMQMSRYQLGRELPPGTVADLVAFLETLTGEYRGQPL